MGSCGPILELCSWQWPGLSVKKLRRWGTVLPRCQNPAWRTGAWGGLINRYYANASSNNIPFHYQANSPNKERAWILTVLFFLVCQMETRVWLMSTWKHKRYMIGRGPIPFPWIRGSCTTSLQQAGSVHINYVLWLTALLSSKHA